MNDLGEALRLAASELVPPMALTPGLAGQSWRAGRRRHARHLSILGLATAAIVIGAGLTTVTLTAHHGTGASLGPAAGSEPQASGRGLTGSLCDAQTGTQPLHFVDWPCARPQADTSTMVRSRATSLLGAYIGVTSPRLRLLADGTDATGHHTGLYELWDADHPNTPALLDLFEQGSGDDNVQAPPGDPATLSLGIFVVARTPVSSVRLQPSGTLLPLTRGVAEVTGIRQRTTTKLVGLDGQSHPVTGATVDYVGIRQIPILYPDLESACRKSPGVGTCLGVPLTARYTRPGERCDTPTGVPPAHYLDWPCATPAANDVDNRIHAAETITLRDHPDIREPRVRLLGDTLHSGSTTEPITTVVEFWDAAGPGPVLLDSITTDKTGKAQGGIGEDAVPAGDPALLGSGALTPAGTFVFARRDVTTVRLQHGSASTTVPVSGGIAYLPLTGLPIDKLQPGWTYLGLNATGRAVATVPFQPAYAAPCTVASSTCTP